MAIIGLTDGCPRATPLPIKLLPRQKKDGLLRPSFFCALKNTTLSDQRSDRNAARTSDVNISGCSHAAK